jgi:ubiquinone/menaquinone biosynthesis C-methylase UbiE
MKNIKASKRKEYIKNIYSKYWISAREKIYGFSLYDKNLIALIQEKIEGGKLLDVAIGTGYPFASTLRRTNKIYGIDIAANLVEKCSELYPDINSIVGDCEDLPYQDGFFDLVYSFHSTWYFPDLIKAISEMMRVTTPNGFVVFDIQNSENKINSKSHSKRVRKYKYRFFYYPLHLIKQIVKMIIGRTDISWQISLHETPTNPQILTSYFKDKGIKYDVWIKNEDESLSLIKNDELLKSVSRLIFLISKS